MADGFTQGFASGLSNAMASGPGGQAGGMTDYQMARLGQMQQGLETQQASAQAQQDLAAARQQGVELDNARKEKEAQFEAGAIQAASVGGFSGAIDYAVKQGNYEWATKRLAEQQDLNASVAKAQKLKADASSSEIKAYNDKMKALGGLSAVFFKDVQSGQDPKLTYERYKSNIKEIWPDAPDEYNDKAANYMKIAMAQQLQQNTNYSRYGVVGKTLDAYNAARSAGDNQAAAVFAAQLKKQQMVMNPISGDFINLMGDVKDNFSGSADDKANAVGLGAGSSIPPIPGAVFKAQPMNNVMANAYADYDKNNKIQPQQRVIANLKAKTGWETVIQPDGTVTQKPIGGSEDAIKPKTQSMEAARLNLLQSSQKAYNDMIALLYDKIPGTQTPDPNNVDWTNLAMATPDTTLGKVGNFLFGEQGVPRTQGRQLRQLFNVAAAGILYGTSGATISQTEKPYLMGTFLPNAFDSKDTIKQKMYLMHELITGTIDLVKYGIDGKPVTNDKGEAQIDQTKLNGMIKYINDGGEALDFSRGNGPNPEKARANKQKELSYNPQQVQKYMQAQYNGQGRNLTEDEAKQFIDGARAAGKVLQ